MTTRLTTALCAAPLSLRLAEENPEAIRVRAAQTLLRSLVTPVTRTVTLPLREALDRVLAVDVVAPIDVPAFDNSAMDGYAFDGAALHPDTETLALDVVATALAGHPVAGPIAAGQCVRIMTGASLPAGTDTVIPHEYAQAQPSDTGRRRVALRTTGFRRGANRRCAGEDLQRGATVLRAGRLLRASDLGLLASLGIGTVVVRDRLRVAYFSTGDELRAVGEPLGEAGVYDSNRYTLHAMLSRLGAEPIDLGVVRDDAAALGAVLQRALQTADAIVSSGGVSAGDADFVRQVFTTQGDIVFWKLAMRPGRPFAFGLLHRDAKRPDVADMTRSDTARSDTARSDTAPSDIARSDIAEPDSTDALVPFYGLPGNPVAVMASFYHIVRDALQLQMGIVPVPVPRLTAYAQVPIGKRAGRTEFVRGIARRDPVDVAAPPRERHGDAPDRSRGQWWVTPCAAQGSGVLRSMSEANCFVILEHEQGNVAAGDAVDIMFFEGLL